MREGGRERRKEGWEEAGYERRERVRVRGEGRREEEGRERRREGGNEIRGQVKLSQTVIKRGHSNHLDITWITGLRSSLDAVTICVATSGCQEIALQCTRELGSATCSKEQDSPDWDTMK